MTSEIRRPAILVVSIGSTDVQLAITNVDGQLASLPFYRTNNRRLSDWLSGSNDSMTHTKNLHNGCRNAVSFIADGSSPFVMLSPTRADFESLERKLASKVPRDCEAEISDPKETSLNINVTDEAWQPKMNCSAYELYATKLLPVVRYFLDNEDQYHVKAVVVINTHRTMHRFAESEPYAVGSVISRWLGDIFELPSIQKGSYQWPVTEDFSEPCSLPKDGFSAYINYLDGDMEGVKHGAGINRTATQRLQHVFMSLRQAFPQNKHTLFHSVGGGLPEFKEPVLALARLHFSNVVSVRDVGNRFSIKPASIFTQDTTTVLEGYQTRRKAIELLKIGDFAGMQGLASAFGSTQGQVSNPDTIWASAVLTAVEWMDGECAYNQLKNAKLGFLPDSLSLPDYAIPRSIWGAFRVEASLRQQNYQDAIRHICDLREMMFYDTIAGFVSNGEYFDTFSFPLTEEHRTRAQRFEPAINIENFRFDNRRTLNILQQLHVATGIGSEQHPLAEFEDRLKHENEDGWSTRLVRNKITHGYIPPEVLAQAKQLCYSLELWQPKESTDSFCFLEQSLFLKAYEGVVDCSALKGTKPAQLYHTFIDNLETLLRNTPVDV